MVELEVRLYGEVVGHLRGERDRFDFTADPRAIARYGAGSHILSIAIPLSTRPRTSEVDQRRNFFEELLAEGVHRERLAGNARLDAANTMGMLQRYGRDVAGAIEIINPGDPAEPRIPSISPLRDEDIRELFDRVRVAPLGNHGPRRLSSLAGIQDKVLLVRTSDGWAEPVDGYPSTHILKPRVREYPTLIYDEAYGSRIAQHLGLAAYDVTIEEFSGVDALVAQRYDRDTQSGARIHQEDFNQALGYFGDQKYEDHGHGGLDLIAATLRELVGREAVARLLRQTTMSIAVGNLDMHAKNLSLLHHADGRLALAPAYDIVPQLHHELDTGFAFAISGEQAHDRITAQHLVTAGRRWGVLDADAVVRETLDAVADFVASAAPTPGAHPTLPQEIARIVDNLRAGRGASQAAGATPRSVGKRLPDLPTATGGWGGPVR